MAARIFSRSASTSCAAAAGGARGALCASAIEGSARRVVTSARREKVMAGSGANRVEDAGPAPRPLVEALEVVFLVRRMDAVVVEAEADEKRVEAERALEVADDGDRAA